MNYTLQYLLNHGYSVLFAWVLVEQAGVPIPSAPILLAAGALVGFGRMNCAAALGLPLVACLIGDCVWFSVGQRRGSTILGLVRRISPRPNVGTAVITSFFSRHGRVSILLAKFVPGFGTLVPPLAGSIGVSPLKFLLFDVFGVLAWAGSHLLLGYLFRKNLETLASVCAKAGLLVAVSAVASAALVVTIRSFRSSPASRNSLRKLVSPGKTGLNRDRPSEVDAPINY